MDTLALECTDCRQAKSEITDRKRDARTDSGLLSRTVLKGAHWVSIVRTSAPRGTAAQQDTASHKTLPSADEAVSEPEDAEKARLDIAKA